jgi:hypothetical protein
MEFADPNERDKVLGPLYATAAKAELPIFGPNKFTSKNVQQLLKLTVQQDLQSKEDPVINLLGKKKPKMGQLPSDLSQSGGSLSEDLDKLQLESQREEEKAESKTSKKTFSYRELHDKAHYTVRLDSTSKSKEELLDHVMLQRADKGYLFDCKANKSIVGDDKWLQGVWEWIQGQ